MRKNILCAAAAFLFFLCVSVQASTVVDRIVGVVNGEIITYQDLLQQIRLVTGQTVTPELETKVGGQVLDSMVDSIILRQEATRLQVDITDTEVDNEIRQFKAKRQLNDTEYERLLRLQGLTPEQFRQRTRDDIVKHKMLGYMVRRKVVVTQQEIDEYLAKNHSDIATDKHVDLQIIVVADEQSAKEVHDRVVSGDQTFEAAVQAASMGPKEEDGTMRDVRWNDLDAPWRDALGGVEIGQISQPFMITDKWVVAKVLARREGTSQGKSAMEEEAREAIMRPRLEERFTEYMQGLRSKAVIEKRL